MLLIELHCHDHGAFNTPTHYCVQILALPNEINTPTVT